MIKFRKSFIALCLIFIVNYANAASINILVNQQDGLQQKESDSVVAFQNSLMDYFFDSGLIVTAENISLAKDTSNEEIKLIGETRKGYFDYFILVKAKVDVASQNVTSANWVLKDINSDEILSNGSLNAKNETQNAEKNAIRFGNQFGKSIYTSVKKW